MHRRCLRQLLPDRWRRWISVALIAVHLPVVVYMTLRLSGYATHGFALFLRPFSLGAMLFQVVTVINLVVWAAASLFWRFRRWWKHSRVSKLEDSSRRAFLRGSAGAGLGLLAVTSGVGVKAAYGDPEITRLDIPLQDLPEGLDGLRIAHLTDLHAGPLTKASTLHRWRAMAEREQPELILFTGDFVDSLPQEIDPLVAAFRGFPAPMGQFAILGNHDYFSDPGPIWQALEQGGIRCLENRHVILERNGAAMALFGLQDPMARNGRFQGIRFGPGPMPQDVAYQMPKNAWRLGMVHRPSNWNLAREAGAGLTLAGHTHGGQINPIPGLNSATMLGPFTQGLYRLEGKALYVSRGLGVVGLPIRIAAPAELAILTLRRAKIPAFRPA
ncbi:MAG: metallophosphoesterase [Holophaga sp.]|nr:metallophosphoesterase [Holophaga sp.]